MSMTALVWLVTAGVLVHNAEEAMALPAWSASAGRWHRPVGAGEFRVAVAALSALLVALAGGASFAGPRSLAATLFAGYVSAMLANVLVPHLLATIAMRRPMPGTATAVALNLPLGVWFLRRALAEGYVDGPTLAWAAPLSALSLVLSIPLLFALGRRVVAPRR
ncbi:MAG: HXXEE domain-containing protein [Holophagales bacterium]|nr:MAG: HXXEE domain-containing protein [Holophagales bacterium]